MKIGALNLWALLFVTQVNPKGNEVQEPSITKYTQILHKYGPDSKQSVSYKALYSYDEKFLRRTSVMDMVFRMAHEVSQSMDSNN